MMRNLALNPHNFPEAKYMTNLYKFADMLP